MPREHATYSLEEKARIDAILDAFRSYIDEHYYFDILYSKKCGYLYVVINEDDIPVDWLEDSADLLNHLYMDISSDVRALQMNGPHTTINLYPEEIEETRRRLKPYFNNMPSELKNFCIEEMNEFFDSGV